METPTPDDEDVVELIPMLPLQCDLFDFLMEGDPTPRQKALGWLLHEALMDPVREVEDDDFNWARLEADLAEVHDFVMSDESTDETFEILVMQLTDTAREVLRFRGAGESDKVLAEVWLELVDRHRGYVESVAQD